MRFLGSGFLHVPKLKWCQNYVLKRFFFAFCQLFEFLSMSQILSIHTVSFSILSIHRMHFYQILSILSIHKISFCAFSFYMHFHSAYSQLMLNCFPCDLAKVLKWSEYPDWNYFLLSFSSISTSKLKCGWTIGPKPTRETTSYCSRVTSKKCCAYFYYS